MEFRRSDRVAELLQQEIADILLRKVRDPRTSTVTVTGVEVTPDLQHAKVYYSMRGASTEEEKQNVAKGLSKAAGFIRLELGKRLHMKHLPQLHFHYDESFEYGDKIERLLKDLHKDE